MAQKSKWDEVLGVVCLALTALVSLALITYDPRDPSLNVATYRASFHNYAGSFGAYLADLLFQVFGLAAYMLPVPLAAAGWKKVRSRAIRWWYFKFLSFGLLLFSISGLEHLFMKRPPYEVNYSSGGVVGSLVGNGLAGYFNVPGATVLLAAATMLGILLSTEASLGGAAERAQRAGSGAARWLAARVGKRKEKPETKKAASSRELTIPEMRVDAAMRPAPGAEASAPLVKQPVLSRLSTPGRMSAAEKKLALPDIDLLPSPPDHNPVEEAELLEKAQQLAVKCSEFDVTGSVLQVHPGPVVTTFEFKPDAGVKYSRITSLVDDLCLALKAESIRIDRIPGKSTVGIEVPNKKREVIYLREIIESETFRKSASKLTLALGKLIDGETYVTDLARMPHLLIAGATGTGKSMAVNAMITSILYKATAEEVKFIMIDPKRLELGVYEDIPHLLTPIVTDPQFAANALRWATTEMENRYKQLAAYGVRNIEQFNMLARSTRGGGAELRPLPYVVILIDELADLMMVASKDVEETLTRLAQMARAVGIHLILSTQRPSVDVITGLIKANFPSRISFRVSSKVDSRTILDSNGGEQLLGNGDMLFLPPGTARLIRVHGAYISEKETHQIADFLRQQAKPEYNETILEPREGESESSAMAPDYDDELYDEAVRVVVDIGKASTSVLQRRLRIGYGRAARLIDLMEREGIVGPPDGSKPREILVKPDYFDEVDRRED
ncbi:MAG: DNA translocase FtsK [Acidobacteria bacterium]|nr:DNA translocase FtsK [Acidobacteriota bacterium]